MDSIKITISASEQEQELLISTLSDLDVQGFEQTEKELIAYFPFNKFNEEELKQLLRKTPYNKEVVKEQNWNEVWESNFEPVVIEDFCAVRADFHSPIGSVEHEIVITPKMSFGTGHHATTYMMIQQMRQLNFQNQQVFDFGTGTGILAILAERLGAASITAIDIDEWSIANAAENLERNGCSRVALKQSSVVPSGETYSVILANINKNVILENLKELSACLAPGGRLLLSGLLAGDETGVNAACNQLNLNLHHKIQKGNWISLLYASR